MSAVKNLLSGPKMPDMPAPPPPPPTVDQARAAAETRDEMLRRRGRKSTILSGEGGVASPGAVGKTTLIGS